MANAVTTLFGLQHQLLDEVSNEPFVGLPYRIIRASGEVITDVEEKIQTIDSGNKEEKVQLIIPDLSEPMERWE